MIIGAGTKTLPISKDNQIPIGVKEQAIKGKIQIHKQYETLEGTPKDEAAAEFQVYLKSAGSYDKAKASERDTIITSASGYAVTKNMPYGTYIVHQTKGGAGREFVDDFEVMISANNQTYSYELLNELKNGQLKIIKTSDDGKVEGIDILPGDSWRINIAAAPSDFYSMGAQWVCSNSAVVSLSGSDTSGVTITAVSTGSATVTVYSRSTGQSASCTVNVN